VQATKGFVTIEELDQPNASQVVDSLKKSTIAHFACHGYTDHRDPSNSGLVLQVCVESELPQQDILTVRDISEINSKQARIAYLSACSTAENRVAQLADEVIHVVSGFQVAGFAHVIGCLWLSPDAVCVEVARGFYSSLFRQGGVRWSNREVAVALREAIMSVRERDLKQPLNWAQFVHYGV
jgi:CHAT domain-containing protein